MVGASRVAARMAAAVCHADRSEVLFRYTLPAYELRRPGSVDEVGPDQPYDEAFGEERPYDQDGYPAVLTRGSGCRWDDGGRDLDDGRSFGAGVEVGAAPDAEVLGYQVRLGADRACQLVDDGPPLGSRQAPEPAPPEGSAVVPAKRVC